MNKLANILVATDFSPGARAALAQAGRIAAKLGARLHVLHVVSSDAAESLRSISPESASAVDGHLRDDALTRLRAELAATDVAAHLDHEPALLTRVGSSIREIVSVVEEVNADLLVIGATGDNNRRMGTTAGRCVRKVRARVLLVPPESAVVAESGGTPRSVPVAFTNIMACVDFSEQTPRVLDEAVRIARITEGTVTGVHVYEVPWERARWSGMPGDALQMEDDLRSLHERRFAASVPASATADSPAVPVKFDLVRGMDHGKGLVAYATEHNVDLVVVGTTGRTAIGYMLLGTTAEKVMRDTSCAVLALK